MSRWLKNVNALLENLDSQVEETVEEHRFNRATAAANTGGDGDDLYGMEGAAVEGLLREEAQGVDDILARRGLLGDDGEEEDVVFGVGANDDGGNVSGNSGQNAGILNEQLEGGDSTDNGVNQLLSAAQQLAGTTPKRDVGGTKRETGVGASEGGVAVSEETINFDGDSSANNDGDGKEPKQDLFADAEIVQAENKGPQTKESSAPTSNNQTTQSNEEKANNASTNTPNPKQAPSSSNLPSAPPSNTPSNKNTSTASLKELRKLRRHVLQLNSDLLSSEREIDAQRQELDRAASRMERDRSRHKQEKESSAVSHAAEVASLKTAHEHATVQAKEERDGVVGEMDG
mmetsp:Transcript_27813/g.50256  ORF Transcript_27813/g.50256 Transcript_27813/m.50256 type:complete len:345 (+) Transcript_27813:244-1278(+)